jgi:glycopeptide antibiotics resistance protein
MSRLSVLRSLLLAYAAAIVAIALTPRALSIQPYPPKPGGLSDFVGNIALFVPLGLLIPLIWPQLRSLTPVAVIAAGSSATIELLQLVIPGRSPSLQDIALNTLGAVIGAILFLEILDNRGQ